MPSKRHLPLVPVIGALLIAGCVSGPGAQTVKVIPQPPAPVAAPVPAPEPTPDPIAILIATSDKHFEAGRKELAVGHLLSAKAEFDRALDTLLESPDGARGNPRLREHFDRLVDRISVLEQAALATGDGFSETKSEPAAIDALLAIETFESTAPKAVTAETVQADLELDDARHSDSDQRPRAPLRRVVSGPAARIPDRRPVAGRAVPADDPGDVSRRGSAARPRVHPVNRKRVQAIGLVEGEGARRLAIHARHRARERVASGLVSRRARRSDEGDTSRGQVPQDALRDVRRLASRHGVLQRRARPREARDDAQPQDRFLVAERNDPLPAARNA